MAAPVALGAVVAVGRAGLHAEPQTTPTAPAVTTTQARSPRNASYAINVRLDPASRTLKGDELLTWRNITTTPATSLRFHLYYNAWRNTASTWMRERRLAGNDQIARRPQADWGWIGRHQPPPDRCRRNAHRPHVDPALHRAGRWQSGGRDGRRGAAGGPGAARTDRERADRLVVARSAHLRAHRQSSATSISSRSGSRRSACSRTTAGTATSSTPATEFFSDFGIYDVRLTVPNGWIVGATGRERARRDEGDGTTTHHYYAEDVHDFAWTTSPDYVERTATFEHAAAPAGVDAAAAAAGARRPGGAALRSATRATLKYYGEWFGPYPYGHITIVDPAWQSGAGGMEYPTLFTAGTRWLAPPRRRAAGGRDGPRSRPSVLVRPGRDQRVRTRVDGRRLQHVLDRADARCSRSSRPTSSKRYFGDFIPWVFADFPLQPLDGRQSAGRLSDRRARRCAGHAERGATGREPAGAITYNKTALWLNTLERLIGWDTLQRIMSTYFARYAVQASDAARTSSPSPTKSAAAT